VTPAERAAMRETLRAALRKTLLPDAPVDHPGLFARPPSAATADLLGCFRTELTALGGVVHEAGDTEDVIAIIVGLFDANADEPRTAMVWDDAALPVPAVGDTLAQRGVEVIRQRPGDLASTKRRAELATATIGVTGAIAALSETGSVVLASGPGRGRLASLLPLIHVAVVRRPMLVESLAELIARDPRLFGQGTNVVCITGPSRTADIEHTLSRGVHGPRDVHVIFVP
jgi:L-lactate dehydrogenase complex protein LldG